MQDKRRKNLKKILFLTLVVSLVGTTSAFAWWGMDGGKRGWHRGGKRWLMMNLTPEQAGQMFDLRQKFMNDTADLRKEMMVTGVELAQLW